MESKPGGWIDILAVGFSILRTRLVVRSISRDHANDHSARGVPEHLLALAGIDRFRTDVYGAARRPSAVYSALEPAWASRFIPLKGRVHTRLEIQLEYITQVTILDDWPLRPIFLTRVSATDIFGAGAARGLMLGHNDISKTGVGHNSSLRYFSQLTQGKSWYRWSGYGQHRFPVLYFGSVSITVIRLLIWL